MAKQDEQARAVAAVLEHFIETGKGLTAADLKR